MRKRTRRKVYQLVNPIQYAIEGAAVTSTKDADQLLLRELSALDAFTSGCATLRHWQDLVDAMNLCESMAEGGIGPEALDACREAQQGLIECAGRFERTGRFGLSGPAIQAIRDLIEYHDLQRRSVARSVYEQHIRRVLNRIRGKAPDVLDVSEFTKGH